jgi:hypothetical protein
MTSLTVYPLESNSLATIFAFVLEDKERANAFFCKLARSWSYGRVGSKSLPLVLALSKALWSLRKHIFPFMYLDPWLTERYFEFHKYKDFTPCSLDIFCSSQQVLDEKLASIQTKLTTKVVQNLSITRYGTRKVCVDLSALQSIVGVKLRLNKLTVRGSALRTDGKDLKIACDRCHISPRANLGRGEVKVTMDQERQLRWEPLRDAIKIKIVATSKYEVTGDFSPNERFLSIVPFKRKMRVRELWIGGEYLHLPRTSGYYISFLHMSRLRKLTFPNRVEEYLFIEECKRLREVVLSSGKYRVTKDQASGLLLVHRGYLNNRLCPVDR